MKRMLILLALAALPAVARGLPQSEQPDCRLGAKAENGTDISCSGVDWPPKPAASAQTPATGIVPVRNREAPTLDQLHALRSPRYRGPEPIGVEKKLDKYERPLPLYSKRQVADKKFWFTVALASAGTIVDAESTKYGLGRGFEEVNPIFGPRPSRARLYGIKFGLQAMTHILLYTYKKWDMQDGYIGAKTNAPKWWHVSMFWPVLNFAVGMHNFAQASGHRTVQR